MSKLNMFIMFIMFIMFRYIFGRFRGVGDMAVTRQIQHII